MVDASTAAGKPSPPQPGDVIDGKFRVERRIGEGGMGLVLEAMHLKLDQRVALKFLKTEAMDRPDVVQRFEQEARAAVRLKSEHIARVLDVGDHRGLPFMVMEFLEGQDLESWLATNGALPVAEAVEFIIQACEGINEAHARGIVHRDVKPANLFISQTDHGVGTLKVLDFGISKAALTGKVSDVDLGSAKTQSLMGSPYYMSPEQLRSTKDVDLRTDIWALGVVLFELITARTAFEECNDFAQLVVQILERSPRKLADFVPNPPAGLQAVLDRCFERDRNDRYRSAAELAIALVPFAKTRGAAVIASRAAKITRASGIDPNLRVPWSIPPGAPDSNAALARTDLTLSPEYANGRGSLPQVSHPPEPKRRPVFLIAGIGAVLLIGGAVVAFRNNGADSRPPATSTATGTIVANPTPVVTAVDPTPAATAVMAPTTPLSASASSAAAAPSSAASAAAGRAPTQPTPPRTKPAPRASSAPPAGGPNLEIIRER